MTPELIENLKKIIDALPAWALRFSYNVAKGSSFYDSIGNGVYNVLLGEPLNDAKFHLRWALKDSLEKLKGNPYVHPSHSLKLALESFPDLYKELLDLNDSSVFLESPELQEKDLLKLGWAKSDEGYGLVNRAVTNFMNTTGKKVPVYVYGKSDLTRDNLIPLNNSIYAWLANPFDDPGSVPTRLYRDSEGNIYYKSWDFLDHGSMSRNNYSESDDLYETKGLTTASQNYGDILDLIGNPFVRTTGYTKTDDLPNIMWALSQEFPSNKEEREKFKARINSGEFDIKKLGGSINYLKLFKLK